MEKARAQVHQAQAALEQAKVDLDRTIIRSPVTGTVISRSVDVGQTVAASLQAPTLFTIAQDLTKMQVDTNVSEADVGHVVVGQAATFTVDAYPGQVMRGTVREIRAAPIIVQNVVNYNAVIAVDNPELKLKPGMTATVSILVAQQAERAEDSQSGTTLSAATDAPRSASSLSRRSSSNRQRMRHRQYGGNPTPSRGKLPPRSGR